MNKVEWIDNDEVRRRYDRVPRWAADLARRGHVRRIYVTHDRGGRSPRYHAGDLEAYAAKHMGNPLPQEKAEIAKALWAGESRSSVAKRFGRDVGTIRRIAREEDIPLRSQIRMSGPVSKQRKPRRRIPEHLIPAFHDFFSDVVANWARKKVAGRAG